VVNDIRVVGHVDDEVARRVQRAVVAVAAAVHLREAGEREEQGGKEAGDEVGFHGVVSGEDAFLQNCHSERSEETLIISPAGSAPTGK